MKLPFLNFRQLVLFVILILVSGIAGWINIPRAEIPFLQPRHAIVTTVFPGNDAFKVETLVTDRLEAGLRTIEDIDEIHSVSTNGASSLSLSLRDDLADLENVWSQIRERLQAMESELPPGASAPVLNNELGFSYTLLIALTPASDETADLTHLQQYALHMRDELVKVKGTKLADVIGGIEEEFEIAVVPEKLLANGLAFQDVSAAVAGAITEGVAGELRGSAYSIPVDFENTVENEYALAAIPLPSATGGRIRLGDVSSIAFTPLSHQSEMAYMNGQRTIYVGVRARQSVSIDSWIERARGTIENIAGSHDPNINVAVVYDQSQYTDERIVAVLESLLYGLMIVITVVALTLGLKSSFAISAAMLLKIILMTGLFFFIGVDINEMSLVGIIVSLGLIVDNSIIVTNELRLAAKTGPLSPDRVRQSISWVSKPLLISTLTTIIAFMPIIIMPGQTGEFVSPMALAVVCALVSSYVISIFVLPHLILFGRTPKMRGTTAKETRPQTSGLSLPWLAHYTETGLAAILRRPLLGILGVLVVAVMGFTAFTRADTIFFPQVDRDQFRIFMTLPPGVSINETASKAQDVERYVGEQDGVQSTMLFIGRSGAKLYYNAVSWRRNTPNYAEIIVNTQDKKSAESLLRKFERDLQIRFPGIAINAQPYIFGPPITTPVEIRIFGEDLDYLERVGLTLGGQLSSIKGTAGVDVSTRRSNLKYVSTMKPGRSERLGLKSGEAFTQMRNGLIGRQAGTIDLGSRQIPVIVRLQEAARTSEEDIANFVFAIRDETHLSRHDGLANLSIDSAWNTIRHVEGRRAQIVSAYVTHGAFASEVEERLEQMISEDDFLRRNRSRMSFAGEGEEAREQLVSLISKAAILSVVIVVVLVVGYNSFGRMFIIISSGVLVLSAACYAIVFTGTAFGFVLAIGMFGLLGVALNDTIMIISALDEKLGSVLPDSKQTASAIAAILVGHTSRHIISTTLTTSAGFIPLMLVGGYFWPPFAIVFALGLILAMPLILVFVPCAYVTYRRFKQGRLHSSA